MRIFLLLITCSALASCLNNAEIGSAKDVDPKSIYYDYTVSGEEGSDDATMMLQYRFGGRNGTTLVLDSPAKVLVDGVQIKVDSAKLTGAFYELIKPAASFNGNHTILFTDRDGKEHKEEFSYRPFALANELPEKIKRQPFTIKLNGFDTGQALVRLVMMDTAFKTRDVNMEVYVESGQLRIDSMQLANLKNGPINLELYREEERPLKQPSKEGGRLQITYSLKRQFELID